MTELTEPVPPRLYKYMSYRSGIEALRKGLIRLTQASALNDVFELQPVFSRLATEEDVERVAKSIPAEEWTKHLKKLRRQDRREGQRTSLREVARVSRANRSLVTSHATAALEQRRAELRDSFLKDLDATIGLLCLTEDPSNILMWAHYAERHEGFVIEFDSGHAWFELGREEAKLWGYLGQVRYSEERVPVIAMQATNAELFLMKSGCWSYEREWRLFRRLGDAREGVQSDGCQRVHLLGLDRQCVAGVILGCRMNDANRHIICDVIGSDAALKHVRVRQAVADENRYALRIESC